MKLKNIFTKILAACLLMALLVCVVACGDDDTPVDGTDSNTVEVTEGAEDTGDVTDDGQTTEENTPADPDTPYTDGISDDTAADIF